MRSFPLLRILPVLLAVGCASLGGCRSSQRTHGHGGGRELAAIHMDARARGFFYEDEEQGAKVQRARLLVSGIPRAIELDAGGAILRQVTIYGRSGNWDANGVRQSAYRLATLPVSWSLADLYSSPAFAKRWSSGWRRADWDGGSQYTLLVHGDYDVWIDGDVLSHGVEDLRHFSAIVPSPRLIGAAPGGGGSTVSKVTATGSFFGAERLAFYDVEVDSSLVPAGTTVTRVTITHEPDGGIPVLLGDFTNPTGPGNVWRTSLRGRYNGANTYRMYVHITYSGEPAPTQDEMRTFSGLESSGGHMIVGS